MTSRKNQLNLSISGQIYELLKKEIIACELLPGDRLLVQELAKRFDVSQAPVREALEKLKQDDLVDSRPNRGVSVSNITRKKMQDLFDVRVLMEGYAVRNTVGHLTEEDLQTLAQYVEDMDQAMKSGDKWNAAMADLNFHAFIYHHCGNQVVAETWNRIQMTLIRYMTISQQKVEMARLAEDHRTLLEAVRTRNPGVAEQAFVFHVGESIHMEILSNDT